MIVIDASPLGILKFAGRAYLLAGAGLLTAVLLAHLSVAIERK